MANFVQDNDDLLVLLKRIDELSQQNFYQFRKLSKLHEKLAERDQMLSLAGAVKLYKAYESALECLSLRSMTINESLERTNTVLKCRIEVPSKSVKGMPTEMDIEMEPDLLVESGPELEAEKQSTPLAKHLIEMVGNTLMDPEETGLVRAELSANLPAGAMEESVRATDEPVLDIMGSPERSGLFPEPESNGNQSVIQPGSTVAVLCQIDKESSREEWVIATTIKSFTDAGSKEDQYEVEDVEFEDTQSSPIKESSACGSPIKSKEPLRFVVSRSKIRLLPSNETEALRMTEHIKSKQKVLALFPGTTCLYPALVVSNPAKRKKTRDFLLKFVDDDVSSRAVPARYVLPQ